MNKSGDTRNSQETWKCYKPEYHYGSTQDWIFDHLRQKEQLFVEMENNARKLGLQINQEKTKYMIVERKHFLKENNRSFENKKLHI